MPVSDEEMKEILKTLIEAHLCRQALLIEIVSDLSQIIRRIGREVDLPEELQMEAIRAGLATFMRLEAIDLLPDDLPKLDEICTTYGVPKSLLKEIREELGLSERVN